MQTVDSQTVLLGEPYTGESKFMPGDVLKDERWPSRERLTVLSVEVQQVSPWHTAVIYELESNVNGHTWSYKDVLEQGGWVCESSCDAVRKVWNILVERVKSGELKPFEP